MSYTSIEVRARRHHKPATRSEMRDLASALALMESANKDRNLASFEIVRVTRETVRVDGKPRTRVTENVLFSLSRSGPQKFADERSGQPWWARA